MVEELDVLADFHAALLALFRMAISPKAPTEVVATDLPRSPSNVVNPF